MTRRAWTANDVQRVLIDPRYALIEPPLISADEWVAANVTLIATLGAEQYSAAAARDAARGRAMTACRFPGCVALAAAPDDRCAVHRNPGPQARACPDCVSSPGWRTVGHPCETCGGTGYATQHPSKPKDVAPATRTS